MGDYEEEHSICNDAVLSAVLSNKVRHGAVASFLNKIRSMKMIPGVAMFNTESYDTMMRVFI